MPPREEDGERAPPALKLPPRSSKYFAKSAGLLQTDYTIDAKSVLGLLLPDRKLPRYGSLPRRPRQLEGREMSHDVLEDSDYPRASPNVSNPISSEAFGFLERAEASRLAPRESKMDEDAFERWKKILCKLELYIVFFFLFVKWFFSDQNYFS